MVGWGVRLGILFLVLAAGLTALALVGGGGSLLWLWPAASFAVVALGYLGLGSRVFGKRADGTLPLRTRLGMFPYLVLAWVIWQGLRRTRVPPYSLVAPGIYLSRRLKPEELPPEVELIVDMTSEFETSMAWRAGRRYRALPTLDAHVPADDEFALAVEEVAASSEVVLVHCAAGLGRSASFVAAVLIRRGLAGDFAEAERILRAQRPIRIGRAQRELVLRVAQRA